MLFGEKKTYLSEVMLRVLMKESSMSFHKILTDSFSIKKSDFMILKMRCPSVPMQKYKKDVTF